MTWLLGGGGLVLRHIDAFAVSHFVFLCSPTLFLGQNGPEQPREGSGWQCTSGPHSMVASPVNNDPVGPRSIK
jgi:hypothetical protein